MISDDVTDDDIMSIRLKVLNYRKLNVEHTHVVR